MLTSGGGPWGFPSSQLPSFITLAISSAALCLFSTPQSWFRDMDISSAFASCTPFSTYQKITERTLCSPSLFFSFCARSSISFFFHCDSHFGCHSAGCASFLWSTMWIRSVIHLLWLPVDVPFLWEPRKSSLVWLFAFVLSILKITTNYYWFA